MIKFRFLSLHGKSFFKYSNTDQCLCILSNMLKFNIYALLLGTQRFSKSFWQNVSVTKVDTLPFDINRKCVYEIPYERDKRMKATVDGRPWCRDMPVKWKGTQKGSVRAQHCKGSYKCKNAKCGFKQQHGKANNVQFENDRESRVICKGCGYVAVFVPCTARKYMEFVSDNLKVRIYHVGMHTCKAKRKVSLPSVVEDSLRRNPKLKTIRSS